MLATQQQEQANDLEKHKRETLNALVGEQVIDTLGKPGNLLRVIVRLLWENYYRVNVVIGTDVTSTKIANSYFVEVDGDGTIVDSMPKITKQY